MRTRAPIALPYLSLLLCTSHPIQSLADCSAVSGNPTVSCSGNLQDGVSFAMGAGQPFPPLWNQMVVQGLTGDIAPTNYNQTGILFANYAYGGDSGAAGDDAVPLTLSYDGGPYAIQGQGGGIVGLTFGGAGSGVKGKAGAGGDAGGVTLNFTSGSVTTTGPEASGLFLNSTGGQGGSPTGTDGGTGGNGGGGGTILVNVTQGSFSQQLGGFGAILAQTAGGAGGVGGERTAYFGAAHGGVGGNGGSGGSVTINLGAVTINETGGTGAAVLAQGIGGAGGTGGEGWSDVANGDGGAGGAAGDGGAITITSGTAATPGELKITTTQANQHGVQANSVAGMGGTGGFGDAALGSAGKGYGGNGGQGGAGGSVSIDLVGASIQTAGQQALGVFARSYGGAGGEGGAGNGAKGVGGSGAGSGPGGSLDVTFSGTLSTSGEEANGLFAQSIGGFSGNGGTASGFVAYGAGSESAGAGGAVSLTTGGSNTTITTKGDWAVGLTAQSVGGGGGKGGKASGIVALGGSGSASGDGGAVTLTNAASITTSGQGARGISAGSQGGGGGEGGGAGGIVSIGGQGGGGGNGGAVTVTNSGNISTTGDRADGIFSGSQGGGGGSAHSTSGLFTFGGSGGGGGAGGAASTINSGNISTGGANADGAAVQSIGGGGGKGSNAVAVSGVVSLAIGGSGGNGGNGGGAAYTDNGVPGYQISTAGDWARGVFVQSVGGGGGDSGNAISASGSPAFDIAIGASGAGGPGGSGGDASASVAAYDVSTAGILATGVFVQSVGGGGGSAGTTVAAAEGAVLSYDVAVGGQGGAGGSGGQASLAAAGEIETQGVLSHGVFAQSVGGGGGHSGATVTGSAVSGLTLSANLGGGGGNGGAGGVVTAAATGLVETHGDLAYGVNAASIGGGGGAAHFAGSFTGVSGAAIAANVGGAGGGGGDGGSVSVTTEGILSTAGLGAVGVAAASIGGGGGDSGTTLTASALSGGAVGISVGGNGGAAGSGGTVSVTNTANITTRGILSEAIRAHSIGRGGGNSGTLVTANGLSLGDIGIGVGGNGGAGGASGDVTVTNQPGLASQGTLSTSGTFATAIDAKSIAGGGGNAKGSITASGLTMGSLTATVGGDGGGGGTAGKVTVNSNGAVGTGGDLAYGILAQSLGGSGGEGGFAIEAGFTGGEVSGSLNVALGGTGGGGSTGGAVQVSTQGSVKTQGLGSLGLVAQSIGGNGGVGGGIYSGNVSLSSQASGQVNLDLGGDGGSGAIGGAVTVNNAADIETQGFFSSGILAQSIGGNGGLGGSVYTVVTTVTPGSNVNLGGSVGGFGGAGNHAGTVEVDNSGAITTTAGGATAIHAQSIGGGGGRAGKAANININLTGGGTGSSFNGAFDLNVGGSGGAAGDGNSVTVNNQGAISTAGASAKGIVAQSVGGGGGDGGTASSDSIGLNGVCKLATEGSYLCSTAETPEEVTQVSASLTIEIGGKGGAAGNGGAVNVANSGAITTTGALGHAIVAHSHGGGGGDGGEGALGVAAWTTNQLLQALDSVSEWSTQVSDFTSVGVGVGGSGGANGNGGNVTVTNSASLSTAGDHAFGIHAQSVGGGGGNGGAGSTGFTTNVTVGGRGSGGGNGGSVSVSSPGAIQTQGRGSVGIFAQSVGGGGGTAGDVEMGFTTEKLNLGVGVGVQQAAGNGGDGGAVSVTSGAITTSGIAAHGIVAQSVGGSGGIAGNSGLLGGGPLSFAGSVGDPGNAGTVSVTLNGAVSVSGQDAHGVFAQSASGKRPGDTSGDVTVNVNANITANGLDGRAILAQSASVGDAQNGTIAVNIAPGVTVATGASGNETLYILNGANNRITNQGTLSQANGASYVIRADGVAATSVDNSGTITGSILGAAEAASPAARPLTGAGAGAETPVSASKIDLLNRSSGVLNAGSLLDVRTLTNQGRLAVGGADKVGPTRLTGDLVQGSSGILALDLDPGRGTEGTDRLSIGGHADLKGQVVVSLLDASRPLTGRQSVQVLSAEGGLSYSELAVRRSAVAQYALHEPTSGALHLSYDIDFANPGILAETNRNQDDIARHLHGIYQAGALDSDLARTLVAIEDTATYERVMNNLGAEIAVDNQLVTLLSGIGFNDALLSCAGRTGDYRFFDQGQCGWMRVSGQHFDQRQTGDNLGFDADTWQIAAGAQLEVGSGWYLGGALSYEGRNLNAHDSNAGSDGGQFQVGVSAKRRFGATELSGALAVGYGSFDIDRSPWAGTSLSGTQHLWRYSAQARAAQLFELGRWTLKPRIDLGVDYLSMDGFSESGNSPFRLRIDDQKGTYFNVQPAVDFLTEIETQEGLLIRPRLTLGITQFFGGAAPEVSGRFAAAPGDVAPFHTSTALDKTRFDLAAGADFFTRDDWVIRAELFGSFSDNSHGYGGGLKVQKLF